MSRKAHFFVLYYDPMLTFESIVANPEQGTSVIELKDKTKVLFRPLLPSDVNALAIFLENLSVQTRERSSFESYDFNCATELCDAINKYDKLRFVCEADSGSDISRIVGLLELSFGIPESDVKRFADEGISLNEDSDVRFGPTLADDFQGRGLGTKAFNEVVEIVRNFGKKRILLWGGVLELNFPAVKYYEKLGFKKAATFIKDGKNHFDMILAI